MTAYHMPQFPTCCHPSGSEFRAIPVDSPILIYLGILISLVIHVYI
uniref:Uncharacterized protein n=1 Tax=Anguilla anguilla TaxID=7936 RepID=A0A0E9XN37_ANGAN